MRTFVPEGLSESSPVRSAGLTVLIGNRPGRGRDDRTVIALAELRAIKAWRFDRPWRDGDVFIASFPSTSYWATFTESLRDKSPHRTILALKLTRMDSRRTNLRLSCLHSMHAEIAPQIWQNL